MTAAAEKFTLIPEQAEALAQLTEKKGFGMLWGEAGTGKSHTLKAVRSVYEQEGFQRYRTRPHQQDVVSRCAATVSAPTRSRAN